jgi:O-antigen biosynthesis protein
MNVPLSRVPTDQDLVRAEGYVPSQASAASDCFERPHVRGKFLFVGWEKFWVKGVTYGTFRPDEAGSNFPPRDIVSRDFHAMARAGLNSVRVYTIPPCWLLDLASLHGLRVMVGLPWEQHLAFLEEATKEAIVERLRSAVHQSAGHPAILCYAIGNEIPGPVVRWYGARKIEGFLRTLAAIVRKEDPGALLTYVNYPTTEYLDLSMVDFVSFNVYLESRETLASYLAHLQNVAGERPLMMAEIGLDSRRNGLNKQAEVLTWQIDTAFEVGCVGAFLFAWTDDWWRGGHEIEDWDFGLTTRSREPKPALTAISEIFQHVPFPPVTNWPRVSVVVCSYNGAATIGETLTELEKLEYSNYEVIVVDDGSTDGVSEIARQYNVRLIQQENQGLSAARNVGLHAATGDIVAYIDDDAYPDPHWLSYVAAGLLKSDHVGIGGPNLAPSTDGEMADCIANAPGGPMHVLLTDEVAEHIPGCNMAFRRDRLIEVGGFDVRFRVAGDDVDLCWRMQERGWTIGFSPAAVVWHHRRRSMRRYLKQQWGYARAEAILAEKWPGKYNSAGHLIWHGRLYGRGRAEPLLQRSRIYHGIWGSALFQSIYEPAPGVMSSLSLMPEWYCLLIVLAALMLFTIVWPPLLVAALIFCGALTVTILQALRGSARASFYPERADPIKRLKLRSVVMILHLLQPAARLLGRIQYGLGPWRRNRLSGAQPTPRFTTVWCEHWQSPETRLAVLTQELEGAGSVVSKGGAFDRWDLTIQGGLFGSVRALAMVEEHGSGKQLFRLRAWPKVPGFAAGTAGMLAGTAVLAILDNAWTAAGVVALGAMLIVWRAYADCATAMAQWLKAAAAYSGTEH